MALRPSQPTKLIRNPSFIRHFSSSSSSDSDSKSPPSSYFSDVKASLNQQPPPRQQHPGGRFSPPPTQAASLDQIRKNLAEFRHRSAAPSPAEGPSPSVKPVSFQELYKRNVASKKGGSGNETNQGGKLSFAAIRESLSQLRGNTPKTNENPLSLKKFKESFTLRPTDPRDPPFVIGSPEKLPESVFSKELKEKKEGDTSPEMKTEFVKMYSYKELGEKLRKLRPEGTPEGGFSLQELNERLMKLREMEQREMASTIGDVTFKDLRESLIKLQISEKNKTIQKLDLFHNFGQTPAFMLKPPQEHLVEKYFHPDNMSSAEKLKIELQKVRDEFKMSESDCGSARVQVAQLTTKIKHLSTALNKKDKHSRRGLQGMIQHRKKLLKYLRRTDWDSYTLVLSKLGLRDNPDYKN